MDESPAKVHRYLASLVEEALVVQDSGSQHYHLGSEAIQIGLAAMRQADPIRVAEPALIRLREALEVTCFVAVMGNKGPDHRSLRGAGPAGDGQRARWGRCSRWCGRPPAGPSWASWTRPRVRAMAEEELACGALPNCARSSIAKDPLGVLRREILAAQCAPVQDTYLRGISAVAAPVYDYTGPRLRRVDRAGCQRRFRSVGGGEIAAAGAARRPRPPAPCSGTAPRRAAKAP